MVWKMSYFKTGLKILKKINQNGYEAYFIGGVVRDYLLNTEIVDIDITTNMSIDKVEQLFTVVQTGMEYGGVTVVYENFSFEITHYRKDLEYLDHRHPIVSFVDTLMDDVVRRDYTINAIAMDYNLSILDYVNGKKDLTNHLIRCIQNPYIKFEEDPLRILRGLYLVSKYNFIIEDETLKAMISKKSLLKELSNERIYEHFLKIVYNPYFSNAKNYIQRHGLFEEITCFSKWIDIIDPSYKEEDLGVYYYLKYNEFPCIMSAKNKKRAQLCLKVIENQDDIFFIYKNKNDILLFEPILTNIGIDMNYFRNMIQSLVLKDDLDLQVSKKELSMILKDCTKTGYYTELIITNILLGKLENKKESIIGFLKEMDVLE